MRFTLWLFARELITLDISRQPDAPASEPGDCLTTAAEVGDIDGGIALGFTTRGMTPCEFE